MTREIVLDTETTGLDPARGDRLIEIGCVELINRMPTGAEFHCYINPERDVPIEAVNVHGLTTEFLVAKPKFADVADDFLSFIGDDVLVIHNANFDIGFLNAELLRLEKSKLGMDRVVDTLQLARRKHPAGPNTLDALCKRYAIDNSDRTKHGALIDSLLLAKVYIELLGEKQATLSLAQSAQIATRATARGKVQAQVRPEPLAPRLSVADEAAHRKFVESFQTTALWIKNWES